MALLEVKNLGISFGGLRAVDEFNVSKRASSTDLSVLTVRARRPYSIC